MPESQAQLDLAGYLTNLLSEQFDVKDHFVTGNLEIRPSEAMKCPFKAIVPDVAVFKGCVLTPQERLTLSSWDMSRANRPAPQVVFEIASENTWRHDLDNKPDDYRLLGVKEYFAYDPVGFWQRGGRGMSRLRGWRYIDGKTQEIKPDEQGRLFSEELDSYLVEDGGYLRLYDRQGNRRLTKTEAAQAARDQAQTARDQRPPVTRLRPPVTRLRPLVRVLSSWLKPNGNEPTGWPGVYANWVTTLTKFEEKPDRPT